MQCTGTFFLSNDLKVKKKKKVTSYQFSVDILPFEGVADSADRQTALRFFSPTPLCKIKKARGAHSLLPAPCGSSSVKNLRSLVFAVAAAFQTWDVFFPRGGSFSPHRQMSRPSGQAAMYPRAAITPAHLTLQIVHNSREEDLEVLPRVGVEQFIANFCWLSQVGMRSTTWFGRSFPP